MNEAQLLLKDMKDAWSQKKNRDQRNGRKGYSFVMGNDIQKKLEQLAKAKGAPINITLEAMIKEDAGFNVQLQAEHKARLDEIKFEFKDEMKNHKQNLARYKNLHDVAIRKRDKEIELLHEKIKELFLNIFKKHLILRDNHLADKQLTEEQENQLLEHVVAAFDRLHQDIEQETDKIRSAISIFHDGVISLDG